VPAQLLLAAQKELKDKAQMARDLEMVSTFSLYLAVQSENRKPGAQCTRGGFKQATAALGIQVTRCKKLPVPQALTACTLCSYVA